jgi:hypothetical protein
MPKKTRVKRTETIWNLFVQQPDTQVNSDHAGTTELYLKHMDRNFRRLVDPLLLNLSRSLIVK